jgi:hypothetical protein
MKIREIYGLEWISVPTLRAALDNVVNELEARKKLSLDEAEIDVTAVSAHEAAASTYQEAIDLISARFDGIITKPIS